MDKLNYYIILQYSIINNKLKQMNSDDFDALDNEIINLSGTVNDSETSVESGRVHPKPHDRNKHYAWGIYKKNIPPRRPTCRTKNCFHPFPSPPPPPPPPPPAITVFGGRNKKKWRIKTKKNKYSKKNKSKRSSIKSQKKTRKYK